MLLFEGASALVSCSNALDDQAHKPGLHLTVLSDPVCKQVHICPLACVYWTASTRLCALALCYVYRPVSTEVSVSVRPAESNGSGHSASQSTGAACSAWCSRSRLCHWSISTRTSSCCSEPVTGKALDCHSPGKQLSSELLLCVLYSQKDCPSCEAFSAD